MSFRTVLALSPAQQRFAARFALFVVAEHCDGAVVISTYQYLDKVMVHFVDTDGHCFDLSSRTSSQGDLALRQQLIEEIDYNGADATLDTELLRRQFNLPSSERPVALEFVVGDADDKA